MATPFACRWRASAGLQLVLVANLLSVAYDRVPRVVATRLAETYLSTYAQVGICVNQNLFRGQGAVQK